MAMFSLHQAVKNPTFVRNFSSGPSQLEKLLHELTEVLKMPNSKKAVKRATKIVELLGAELKKETQNENGKELLKRVISVEQLSENSSKFYGFATSLTTGVFLMLYGGLESERSNREVGDYKLKLRLGNLEKHCSAPKLASAEEKEAPPAVGKLSSLWDCLKKFLGY